MDKNTLSNYGWIVIAVLVLSVMIALATPFGSYIEQGVRSTTQGLFDTQQNAMNSAFADLGVQVKDQNFALEGDDGTLDDVPVLHFGKTYSGVVENGMYFVEFIFYENGSAYYINYDVDDEIFLPEGTFTFKGKEIISNIQLNVSLSLSDDGTTLYYTRIYESGQSSTQDELTVQ